MPGLGAEIEPNKNLTFEGDLLLKFHVGRENTTEIELNALKLEIDISDLRKFELNHDSLGANNNVPKVTEIKMDKTEQKV